MGDFGTTKNFVVRNGRLPFCVTSKSVWFMVGTLGRQLHLWHLVALVGLRAIGEDMKPACARAVAVKNRIRRGWGEDCPCIGNLSEQEGDSTPHKRRGQYWGYGL
jgi:hypothetical protein